jgi:hypothetical protein
LKMKSVWDACVSAEIAAPREVQDFFQGESPDDKGVTVDFGSDLSPKAEFGVTKWRDEFTSDGFEIELAKLPKDVKILRFVCSW